METVDCWSLCCFCFSVWWILFVIRYSPHTSPVCLKDHQWSEIYHRFPQKCPQSRYLIAPPLHFLITLGQSFANTTPPPSDIQSPPTFVALIKSSPSSLVDPAQQPWFYLCKFHLRPQEGVWVHLHNLWLILTSGVIDPAYVLHLQSARQHSVTHLIWFPISSVCRLLTFLRLFSRQNYTNVWFNPTSLTSTHLISSCSGRSFSSKAETLPKTTVVAPIKP